jgi:ADP-ribose pyrophosphatase YjhB (NUDIX family)
MSEGATDAVGAVVLHEDGRVLLVKRARPPLAGAWSLPGGRPLQGEPLARACAREVFEETGIEVVVERELEVVTIAREGYSYAIHEHLCRPRDPSAEPRAADDAADARWARADELAALGVSDEVSAVIARARATASRRPASR